MKEMTEDQKIDILKNATIFDNVFTGIMQTEKGAICMQIDSELIELSWEQIKQLRVLPALDYEKLVEYYKVKDELLKKAGLG